MQEVSPSAIDHGQVLMQQQVPVPPEATYTQLHHTLGDIGASLLLQTLADLAGTRAAPVLEASVRDAVPSRAPKLSKQSGVVVWSAPARVTHNLCRALTGYPGVPVQTSFNGVTVHLLEVEVPLVDYTLPHGGALAPGELVYDRGLDLLLVGCGGGGVLGVKQLQLACKSPVSARTFALAQLKWRKRDSSSAPETPGPMPCFV